MVEASRCPLIGRLYYDIGKQDESFKLAIAYKKEDGDLVWSKWRTFLDCCNDDSFLRRCNNRSILKSELILDIDLPKEEAHQRMVEICKELKEVIKTKYRAYFTGSKGYHIHVFDKRWLFMTQEVRQKKKINLIKHFNCDTMKGYDNVMIAMEDVPHWKTGNKKELVTEWMD